MNSDVLPLMLLLLAALFSSCNITHNSFFYKLLFNSIFIMKYGLLSKFY